MTKRVLDVGNCDPDHSAITRFITGAFDAHVTRAYSADDALAALRREPFDLVIVNRKFDIDHGDGIDLIRHIKSDAQIGEVPAMLLSNFPEYQQEAIAAGAVPGFGKKEYAQPETKAKLNAYLT
jgi:CheY-like chemotaxis protein